MKYIIFLGDGMADYPCEQLGGKTPLESAFKPHIDKIAQNGTLGLVKTVCDELSPGSDVANLSVLGYDPLKYYTGRSPLEAFSIGVDLKDSDVTFRANLVTLSEDLLYQDKTMIDYSSDEITTDEAAELIAYLKKHLIYPSISLYKGISYRHLLVWDGGSLDISLTPPHDISDRKVTEYLPKGQGAHIIHEIMQKSYELLENHPINIARKEKGLHPANSLWIWGEGKKPMLDNFYEKFGVKASVISAVDLLKGIGKATGMNVVEVEGATGNIHTNFEGKAQAAIHELKNGQDLVYIHVEAPDECGHRNEVENKVRAIELIDQKIVKPVMDFLEKSGLDYRVMVTPDHPTPLKLRTHTKDPVPFALYSSEGNQPSKLTYTEANAKKSGVFVEERHQLMTILLNQ